MSNSTQKTPRIKPPKPYPDFPLSPHATKRWAKKTRGKLHYFGPWEDPGGALKLWSEQKDDLLAGRMPRRADDDRTSIRDLCEAFLQSKKRVVQTRGLNHLQGVLAYRSLELWPKLLVAVRNALQVSAVVVPSSPGLRGLRPASRSSFWSFQSSIAFSPRGSSVHLPKYSSF